MPRITMLGAGLIGRFYTEALHSHRAPDRVEILYSRSLDRARTVAAELGVRRATDDMKAAIFDASTDVVVIGLPNHLHEEAVTLAAEAGKAVLCTKPLGRTAAEALRMLEAVEKAGVFHGYLEDLAYTPKTRKALREVKAGSLGRILWARSREAHPGPHSAWFWDPALSGGGAIVDLGCHCIEIARNFIGKDVRPLEVTCWADTQVHPIEAEDHAVGLVRYENGALGQFEVSWTFRGGMDLRDEVTGTEGTLWLNHWLRTGFELFTAQGAGGYVAEKSDSEKGWLFPVGDEIGSLGYLEMFDDMFEAIAKGRVPQESFYDGYVVNAIMDAAFAATRSRQWEAVNLPLWLGRTGAENVSASRPFDSTHDLVKEERMPDGSRKLILREKATGRIVERAS
jgi:predicted dehydrogenase